MSEVKNSTTDIDNNVQEEAPTPTPKKRLSRAEKARLESEELLKSLGVTIESGRQTRSSRRGTTVVESPKPEPPKRKQPSTPRASKKAKVVEVDQTDSTNHVEESNKSETQISEASTTNLAEPEKTAEDVAAAASETVSNDVESEEKMEVDTQIENKPEAETQSKSVPQPETIEDSPVEAAPIEESSLVDDEPPIEEDSLPITDEVVENVPPKAVEKPEVLESEGVSAAADTTTAIVINDSEPIITSPSESNKDKDEPIELQSSPSDIDQQEDTVTNSQAIVADPDAIVDLESSSSNDGVEINNTQALDSLDLEVINSDSSLDASDIPDEQPVSSGIEAAVQEQPLPTSTADVTITDVAPVAKTNDNSVHERPLNAVESTNNQKPIEIPENFRTTITVDNPIEETITTTSETLLEPSATTA